MARTASQPSSMGKKRPQLSLDELHQLKWLLGGALVLLAAWTVFYLDLEAWTLMGLTSAGVLVVLVRPDWPARVPKWAHRAVFPLVVVFFAGDLVITREVLPAIVRLDLLLLLYRGTSYRKKRDDLQVIVLGLFLIVVAGVLTVSLVFAAQILVFTACALVFLLVVTLVDSAEKGLSPSAQNGPPAWTAVRWRHLGGRVRAVTDWRVVLLGGALFVGVVGVSALLFLAIPRFQLENSLFLERFVSRKARSGFNESIRFGEVTEIQQDNSLAVSVDVSDRSQIPANPYWRMLVLDEYRDGTFRMSPEMRRYAFGLGARQAATVRGGIHSPGGEPVFWTFYLEAGISRYLPLLGPFEQLRFREMQNFRSSRELALVALRDEPATMTAYRVEGMSTDSSLPDANFGRPPPINPSPKQPGVPRLLDLKVGEPDQAALRRMVQEITAGAQLPPAEFSRRVNTWLWQRHGYSLFPKIPSGANDVLVRWLDSKEGGHCELFAGSFVLLARTAGYPTRVVTGFRGGTWNAYSNNFTLRNSDAHAWCEVYDRATGAWLRADPTPGAANAQSNEARGEATLARRTDRSWSARLESLRVFWYRRIVNFDQASQVETLQAVKTATENSGRQLRAFFADTMERLKGWAARPWNFARIARLFAAVTGIVVLAVLWRIHVRPWLRRNRRRTSGVRLDATRLEAGLWLAKIAVAEKGSVASDLVGELQRLRFGARASWPEAEKVFRSARRFYRQARKRRIG